MRSALTFVKCSSVEPSTGEGRECAHAVAIHVDAEPAPDVVPCDGQRDEVRASGTAREDRTAAGNFEEIGEPAEYDLLELRGRRPERPEPRVLVNRGGPRVRDRSRREDAAGHIAEVAAPGGADEARSRAVDELVEDHLDRQAVLGQRLVDEGAHAGRVEVDARVPRLVERGP